MIFDRANINHYMFAFGLILVASYVGTHLSKAFEPTNDDDEMIRKYLLNDSPLKGNNRPNIWIHSKHELNARKWKSFQSRSSTDLNQPYLMLTIQSIIQHCGNDFNICLIDDDSFPQLIPTWDITLKNIAEPLKTNYREFGLAQLLYMYGGLVMPNSFICNKNVKDLYDAAVSTKRPFLCENVNKTSNIAKKSTGRFIPSPFFMGAAKNDPVVGEWLQYLRRRNMNPHFSSEAEFLGDSSQWFMEKIRRQEVNVVGGELIGVKTNKLRKPILLDDLMAEEYLDLSPNAYGVYVPADELLVRTHYQWVSVLSQEEVLKTTAIISKYLMGAVADVGDEYSTKTVVSSTTNTTTSSI